MLQIRKARHGKDVAQRAEGTNRMSCHPTIMILQFQIIPESILLHPHVDVFLPIALFLFSLHSMYLWTILNLNLIINDSVQFTRFCLMFHVKPLGFVIFFMLNNFIILIVYFNDDICKIISLRGRSKFPCLNVLEYI